MTSRDTYASDRRKQAVSIRMNGSDIRKVKKLAARLGVHDSDIVRFALKTILARLEPLHDPEAKGRTLLPVFMESGVDIVRFFELDVGRLDAIINDGVEPGRHIERDDLALIALHAMQPPYAALRLSDLRLKSLNVELPPMSAAVSRKSGVTAPDAQPRKDVHNTNAVRQYLYDKYMFGVSAALNGSHHGKDSVDAA